MKTFLILTLFVSTTTLFANEKRVETIRATGFKEISIGGMLNPFGGAVKGAQKIAKKELVKKCQNELNGTIVGEVKFETIRFDEGIMGAEVEAIGNCEF